MKRRAYYIRYLLSPKWQRLRQTRLAKDRYRCQWCGDKKRLEIHHVSYERLGKERLSDLLTLCHACHRDHHASQQQQQQQQGHRHVF